MQEFKPPISETKRLESDVLRLIQRLREEQDQGEEEEDDEKEGVETVSKEEIIAVLNRSLTALSHWVLQAQLMELDPHNQDRVAVENNLLKKEVEYLSNKTATERPPTVLTSAPKVLPKPFISTASSSSTQEKKKKKKLDISQITPKRGEFSPKRGPVLEPIITTTPMRRKSEIRQRAVVEPLSPTSHQHEASPQFRLVENKKPHPRMRRTSDNPSRNEYVRVFHLEKEK
ncbi:Uncharacterized protein RNJ44_01509 [Nakaseomyces bracarensis]|uniref:Uncharacterized protein n=1 Tax=Nakaseomyces bracarensis TaxID=273131 RepID=A0ABR4NQ26_9SACH